MTILNRPQYTPTRNDYNDLVRPFEATALLGGLAVRPYAQQGVIRLVPKCCANRPGSRNMMVESVGSVYDSVIAMPLLGAMVDAWSLAAKDTDSNYGLLVAWTLLTALGARGLYADDDKLQNGTIPFDPQRLRQRYKADLIKLPNGLISNDDGTIKQGIKCFAKW